MNEMIVSNADTINSQTLLQMVNEARLQCGEKEIRNNDFLNKVKDELDGEFYEISVKPSGDKGGRPTEVVEMTYKQAMRVAARESKAVRRSLIDQLEELQQKALAAPQQQPQLIPGTPEHFLDFITQGVTQALTQAYREYFGEPVLQNALVDQQQHTEPVEAVEEQKAIAGPALKHIEKPEDTISQNEMHAFISNDRLLEKLMEMVGLEIDRIHDPQVTPNGKHHQNPYPVYNKKEVYSMLKAAQSLCEELPASQKGHKRGKLFGIPFTMRKEIKKAKLWDGQLFDAARALFELYLEEEQTEQAE